MVWILDRFEGMCEFSPGALAVENFVPAGKEVGKERKKGKEDR